MSNRNRIINLARWAGMGIMALSVGMPLLLSARTDRQDDIDRVARSAQVFKEVMVVPDKAIPRDILRGAGCIAIIPSEKQFALGVGGVYGKGVVSCKTDGHWGAPLFITLGGGTFGAEIGGESSDIVMVFRNRAALDGVLDTKVRLGAGASAAAGPVGRDVSAGTDVKLAGILTYARSRGAFAGVDLNGAVITQDSSANDRMYGAKVHKNAVLGGSTASPDWASTWTSELRNSPE